MNYNEYIFGLELNNANSQHALAVKHTDTGRKLYINLTQDSKPYVISDECWVLFHATKSDGTKVVNECMVSNNIVEYAISEQVTSTTGVVNCSIGIYGKINNVNSCIHSALFNIVVYSDAISIDEVISSDDYQAFVDTTANMKTLMAECEEAVGSYASAFDDVNDSLGLLVTANGVDLTDRIPASSVTVDGVKYNWSADAKKITVNCSNTAATSYDFYTFDLTNEMLKNKTLSLTAKSNNANVVCRYTLTNHQGNKASGVLGGSAYSIKTATYRSVMLTITTAAGYRGVATIELSLKYNTTHSDLSSKINDVADRVTIIEEGGGAVGADGKSAYEIWLEQGNEGTEADFLASLVGEQGENGEDGTSVNITSITESAEDGGASVVYFSDGNTLNVYNGHTGADGESITIVNTEPTYSPSGANKTTITFSDGTSVTISDGERGARGADGDDGKSIEITNIELSEEDGGENKITFSDGELDSVLVIRNGNKGSTPQKGTDYFTAEDKAELVDDVLEALPTWTGGSY